MEILENIRLKLDKILKTFESGVKDCEPEEVGSCELLSKEADSPSPSRSV